MPSWSAPLLVLGLAVLLPWLRWLHRQRRAEAEVPVAAVFLWRRSGADPAVRSPARHPDRLWLYRAAVCGLLVLAAAGPHLERTGGRPLDVYVDDSPRLAVREDEGTRLDLAVDRLLEALGESEAGPTRLISLARPARSLTFDPEKADARARIREWIGTGIAGDGERAGDRAGERRAGRGPLPAAARLRPGAERWLVSDGADPAVSEWATRAGLDRVIQVGRASENCAVTRLALRRSALAPDRLRGAVRVANAGRSPAVRRVEVRQGERTLYAAQLEIPAGSAVQRSFPVPPAAGRPLEARIAPADRLARDDSLTLATPAPAAVPTRVDARCGPHLRAALAVHPGLDLGGEEAGGAANAPTLRVSCAPERPAAGAPSIWIRPDAPPPDPRRRLPGAAAARDPRRVAGVGRGAQALEVSLDMTSPAWARRPEYAAFVAGLVDRAVGRALLDWQAAVGRPGNGAAAARIAPAPMAAPEPTGRGATPAGAAALDASVPLLVAAAVLLCLDVRFAGRRS
ncbi:MAG: BatA domain-containing protein [Myxococcota bacterium]